MQLVCTCVLYLGLWVSVFVFFVYMWVHLLLMCPDLCAEKEASRLLLNHYAPVITLYDHWTAIAFNWGA